MSSIASRKFYNFQNCLINLSNSLKSIKTWKQEKEKTQREGKFFFRREIFSTFSHFFSRTIPSWITNEANLFQQHELFRVFKQFLIEISSKSIKTSLIAFPVTFKMEVVKKISSISSKFPITIRKRSEKKSFFFSTFSSSFSNSVIQRIAKFSVISV